MDRAAESGLNYKWVAPSRRPLIILDTIGNGCAFLDYDGDGNLDILLVGPRLALFRGDGKGRFADVTSEAGLARLSGHFLGCAVGDYDNDGFPDVYITGYETGVLLHNEGGHRFVDVTRTSGINPHGWSTSAAFADIDGDGKLALFVGRYVKFGPASQKYCKTNGVDTSCPPGMYDGEPGTLYRNLGGGRFQDASREWGLSASRGKTLGAAFADFDRSGRQSLALANDEVPGELFRNMGRAMRDVGSTSGIAYSSVGQPQAGMGEDWGDYDEDGRLDLTVMTFATELKPVYHNDGNGVFTDVSGQLNLTKTVTPYVAFGAKWLDADNDGRLDLMITNGHTADNIAETGQGYKYRQPTLFFRNENGKRFTHIPQAALDRPIVGRGLAIGDYDNDGRIDALVVDSEGSPLLLHNETRDAGNWISFHLIGRHRNRDAYGAEVTLEVAGSRHFRHCHSDGSYLSSSDSHVHFGLGQSHGVDKVTIQWQGGAVQSFTNLKGGRIWTVEEGSSPK